MSGLDTLGRRLGTDKSSEHHGYLDVYEDQITPLILASPTRGSLLELGWLDGASVRMWRDWLPSGWQVTGLDIDPKKPIDGVAFVQGEQNSAAAVSEAAAHGPFDVIVDDASHECAKTVASFVLLWPHLKPGGLYFVEDVQTSYFPAWGGRPDREDGGATMRWFKNLADDVNAGHCGVDLPYAYEVDHVAFWPGLAMARKR